MTAQPRLKAILPSTFGVCFLGTPHKGSKSASLGKIAFKISIFVAARRPNVRLLHELERNSRTLQKVTEAFYQTIEKHELQICSFHEEKEMRRLKIFSQIVVTSESAKIGHGKEEINSIPEDHSSMVKFGSSSDIGFKRVGALLRRWINKIELTKNGTLPNVLFNAVKRLCLVLTATSTPARNSEGFDGMLDPPTPSSAVSDC